MSYLALATELLKGTFCGLRLGSQPVKSSTFDVSTLFLFTDVHILKWLSCGHLFRKKLGPKLAEIQCLLSWLWNICYVIKSLCSDIIWSGHP